MRAGARLLCALWLWLPAGPAPAADAPTETCLDKVEAFAADHALPFDRGRARTGAAWFKDDGFQVPAGLAVAVPVAACDGALRYALDANCRVRGIGGTGGCRALYPPTAVTSE